MTVAYLIGLVKLGARLMSEVFRSSRSCFLADIALSVATSSIIVTRRCSVEMAIPCPSHMYTRYRVIRVEANIALPTTSRQDRKAGQSLINFRPIISARMTFSTSFLALVLGLAIRRCTLIRSIDRYRAILRRSRFFLSFFLFSFFFTIGLLHKPQANDHLLPSLISTYRIVLFDPIRRQEARFCLPWQKETKRCPGVFGDTETEILFSRQRDLSSLRDTFIRNNHARVCDCDEDCINCDDCESYLKTARE